MSRFKSVLLVDDDDIDNMVHKRVLQRGGFAERVDVVTTASRALDYLKGGGGDGGGTSLPEALFLDLNMPMMNGFEFLSVLEAREGPKPLVYVLTSSSNSRDLERARSSPYVHGCLLKPLTAEQLRDL